MLSSCPTDSFVEVVGSTDMSPVWPGGRAYAMTNPVFIEAP